MKNQDNIFKFAILTGEIKKVNLKLWFKIKFCVFYKKNPVNWFEFAVLTEQNQGNWYDIPFYIFDKKNQVSWFEFPIW